MWACFIYKTSDYVYFKGEQIKNSEQNGIILKTFLQRKAGQTSKESLYRCILICIFLWMKGENAGRDDWN